MAFRGGPARVSGDHGRVPQRDELHRQQVPGTSLYVRVAQPVALLGAVYVNAEGLVLAG